MKVYRDIKSKDGVIEEEHERKRKTWQYRDIDVDRHERRAKRGR